MDRRVRRSREQWEALLEELSQSTENEQSFCDRHGIGLTTLQNWRRRFAREAEKAAFIPVSTAQSVVSDTHTVLVEVGEIRIRCPLHVGVNRIAELAHALHRGK